MNSFVFDSLHFALVWEPACRLRLKVPMVPGSPLLGSVCRNPVSLPHRLLLKAVVLQEALSRARCHESMPAERPVSFLPSSTRAMGGPKNFVESSKISSSRVQSLLGKVFGADSRLNADTSRVRVHSEPFTMQAFSHVQQAQRCHTEVLHIKYNHDTILHASKMLQS